MSLFDEQNNLEAKLDEQIAEKEQLVSKYADELEQLKHKINKTNEKYLKKINAVNEKQDAFLADFQITLNFLQMLTSGKRFGILFGI